MPKLIKYLLYAGAFVGSFVLFVYWMLPMEAVKTRVIQSIETALGSNYSVKIKEVDTHWITGVNLEDVSILQVNQCKEETVLKAERIKARAGLFSLLFGGPKIKFDATVGKADIKGVLHASDQGWSLDCSLEDVDFEKTPLIKKTTGLNLNSSIEGEIQVNYDARQPLRTVGNVELNFAKLFLKAGDVPLGEMGTFPLPDLSMATKGSLIKATIDKGAINVESLKLKGDDFNLELSGKVFLAPDVSRYRMNLQGKFQFSQKLWGVLDPILPATWLDELKKQKSADDNFPISVAGQFASPQIYSGTVAIYPFKPF